MDNAVKAVILAEVWPVHAKAVGAEVVEWVSSSDKPLEMSGEHGSPMSMELSVELLTAGAALVSAVVPIVQAFLNRPKPDEGLPDAVLKELDRLGALSELPTPVRNEVLSVVERVIRVESEA